MKLGVLIYAGLLAAVTLQGQGSGSVAPPQGPPLDSADRPFEVTRTSVGKLSVIEGDLVVVDDDKIKEPRKLRTANAKIRVTADKQSELGGRKNLKLDDLKAGMYVRVTYRPDSNTIVEIRLLKSKTA